MLNEESERVHLFSLITETEAKKDVNNFRFYKNTMKIIQKNRKSKSERLLFSAIYIIWEQNLPLNENVFYPILPNAFTFVHLFHQIVAQNATERVKFLKTLKIWVFLEKRYFSWKKTIFYKNVKGGKFAVECVSNGNVSLKCLYCPGSEVFLAKNQKKVQIWKN